MAQPLSKEGSSLTMSLLDGHFDVDTQLEEMKKLDATLMSAAGLEVKPPARTKEATVGQIVIPGFASSGLGPPTREQADRAMDSFRSVGKRMFNKKFNESLLKKRYKELKITEYASIQGD